MATPTALETTDTFTPAATQVERAAALRRFNRLYIYTPLVLISLLIIALIVLLLWGSLGFEESHTRQLASGLADIIVILVTIPMMLLCAIVPLAAIGAAVYRQQQRQTEEEEVKYGRLQMLFWRLETLLARVYAALETASAKVAAPLIEAHALAAYVSTFLKDLRRFVSRR